MTLSVDESLPVRLVSDGARQQVALPFLVDKVLHHRQDAHFGSRDANPVQRGYVNVSDERIRSVGHVLQVRPFGYDPIEMIEISFE